MKKPSVLLSLSVKPLHYRLLMRPNLEAYTFTGEETITLELAKPTKAITLHATELGITNIVYTVNKKSYTGKVTFDEKSETAVLLFKEFLPKGKGKLSLEFDGILNDKMRGFYRSTYDVSGKEHVIAVSQFESTDARRAFPCFDEPALKATFDVTLVAPEGMTAISNSIETSVVHDKKAGEKTVTFATSPKMSTYLLAFVVGKFEQIEAKTKEGVLVRVFVTPGKKQQAEFALDVAIRCLPFYEDYFGIAYPLPVLDLIAIPDFAAGAMENWGAVTYRETALLVDEDHSSLANKQWVALVVAHELAHQWFGNLVTMEWWTHLWLNEGFAVFIEYLAVNHLFPKWEIWTQFVNMDLTSAMRLDGLKNTHPIEVPVSHPGEISEIFDAVSYSKGAVIIRMLAEYLGADVFRQGLRKYLQRHQYENATTENLWEALEHVSKKPVRQMMKQWTGKPGYPLVSLEETKRGLSLSQKRFFSSTLSQKETNDKTIWTVPLLVKTENAKKASSYVLDKKKMVLPIDPKNGWIKVNADELSLARVLYPRNFLKRFEKSIKEKSLGATDRFGIVRDAFDLAQAGYATTDEALEIASYFENETEYTVWAELCGQLRTLDNLLAQESYYEQYRRYVCLLTKSVATKLSWEKKKGESHTTVLLRSMLLYQLGHSGDPATITEAQKRFSQYKKSGKHIDPDIRGVVYNLVAENGGKEEYAFFTKLFHAEKMQEKKDRLLRALCLFKQKELLLQTLELAFTDQVRSQDVFKIVAIIFSNPFGRELAWEFVKKHWDVVAKRFSGGHLFPRFITPASHFTTMEQAKDVEQFFKKHSPVGAERAVLQTIEEIRANALWLTRDKKVISSFLNKREQ